MGRMLLPPPGRAPPPLALSGVSGGSWSPQFAAVRPAGPGAGGLTDPLGPELRQHTGCGGSLAPPLPTLSSWSPGAATFLRLPSGPGAVVGSLAGDIRRPEVPGGAGLSGQGDFRLKINGEGKLLIILLGGRWREACVNI